MERERKILFGITKANWGGAQRYVFDLASSLTAGETRHGPQYEVAVMAGKPSQGGLKERLERAGIRFIELPGMGRDIRWFGEIYHLIQIFKVIQSYRPDVLHLNSPKMAGLGAVAGRLLGVRHIVVTVHGWYFNERRNFLLRAVIFFFSWLTSVFAHTTVLITKGDLKAAKTFPFVPRPKFVFIPNGIGEITYRERTEAREVISPHAKDQDSKIWIGMIAELIPNKDVKTAIEAMKRVAGTAHLFIIGSGSEEVELKRQASKAGLADRVHFLGFIPNAAELLPAFDIFALSSVKEGLPYVLLEAGLLGLPVVATSVGGVPDIIEDGKTGILVRPGSPDALGRALDRVIRDENLRILLGSSLQKRVRSEFRLEDMIEKTERLYEN